MNVPCLRNFVESLYDTTLELSSRKKHSLVSNAEVKSYVRNIFRHVSLKRLTEIVSEIFPSILLRMQKFTALNVDSCSFRKIKHPEYDLGFMFLSDLMIFFVSDFNNSYNVTFICQ